MFSARLEIIQRKSAYIDYSFFSSKRVGIINLWSNGTKFQKQKVHSLHVMLRELKDNKNVRGSFKKFPDFFRIVTFIDNTHMKLKSPSK